MPSYQAIAKLRHKISNNNLQPNPESIALNGGGGIVFHAGGFGDLLVCFKAIYALKMLYPHYKLILLHNGIALSDKEFLKNISFIDEVVYANPTSQELKKLNPLCFISTHRSSAFFKELKKIPLRMVVVYPHTYSVFRTNFLTPLFFRRKKHMSECVLQLVRKLNKKHFDNNFSKINFTKVKESLPNDDSLLKSFFKDLKQYEKIIALNAFSSNSESVGFNFFTRDWLRMAFELAKEYPQFCFILLNFEKNPIQFKLTNPPSNLKVFVNDNKLSSLVAITKKLDFLISIDTGNVHLADILQIPSFVFIRKKIVSYRFCGGSYGGEYDQMAINTGWQKEYQKTYTHFMLKIKEKLTQIETSKIKFNFPC